MAGSRTQSPARIRCHYGGKDLAPEPELGLVVVDAAAARKTPRRTSTFQAAEAGAVAVAGSGRSVQLQRAPAPGRYCIWRLNRRRSGSSTTPEQVRSEKLLTPHAERGLHLTESSCRLQSSSAVLAASDKHPTRLVRRPSPANCRPNALDSSLQTLRQCSALYH